jgi:hypothetical protein
MEVAGFASLSGDREEGQPYLDVYFPDSLTL